MDVDVSLQHCVYHPIPPHILDEVRLGINSFAGTAARNLFVQKK
jgi:hypothetical protein